jgi:UDP-N-acetylmuramyl pentapeptide phosphotransferase/UDP-N-acetylglucosamine-1-phosphate transferase
MRALASGAVAGVLAAASLRLLRAKPPGGVAPWERTNHAGRTVTLLEGPAYAAGALGAAALLGAGPGPVLAATAAAGLGALDDHRGDAGRKGLYGHLSALARGEVTTGAVKVIGLVVGGMASAALIDRAGPERDRTVLDTLVGGAVVAGSANLLNLLDLRPGRALKATVALGLLGTRSSGGRAARASAGASAGASAIAAGASAIAAGAAVGAALGVLGPDLAGEAMLGDTGANAAGALLGAALVQRTGRGGRWAALAVLATLTLASEKVSFTRVIESTPVLRELDALGRS